MSLPDHDVEGDYHHDKAVDYYVSPLLRDITAIYSYINKILFKCYIWISVSYILVFKECCSTFIVLILDSTFSCLLNFYLSKNPHTVIMFALLTFIHRLKYRYLKYQLLKRIHERCSYLVLFLRPPRGCYSLVSYHLIWLEKIFKITYWKLYYLFLICWKERVGC